MFWVLMMTNGNIIINEARELRAVQAVPPATRGLQNGFRMYQGPGPNYHVTWLPRFTIVCTPTELGWRQLRAWRDGGGEQPGWSK